MRLSNISTNSLKTSILGNVKGSFTENNVSAPLSAYLASLNAFEGVLNNSFQKYDALAGTFANAPAVSEIQAETDNLPIQTELSVNVDDDEAEMLLNSVYTTGDYFDANCAHAVSFTSGSGLLYTLKLINENSAHPSLVWASRDGDKPCLVYEDGTYKLHSICYPVQYGNFGQIGEQAANTIYATIRILAAQNNVFNSQLYTIMDYVNALARIASCDATIVSVLRHYSSVSDGNISECMDAIFGSAPSSDVNFQYTEKIYSVVNSLVTSSEINSLLLDAITSVKSGTQASWLESIKIGYDTKRKAIKKFINGAVNNFSEFGLKGLILYILDYSKSASNISDENGILVFTNNDQYRPAEYIAGIIMTCVTLAYSAVSLILSIFKPVVSLALSALGGAIMSIVNSFKSDVSSTYATLTISDNIADDIDILPCHAYGLFKYKFNISSSHWYVQSYRAGKTVFRVQVPGGSLFIGPGSFDAVNVDLPTSIACEFHPAGVIYSFTGLASSSQTAIDISQVRFNEGTSYTFDLVKLRDNYSIEDWEQMYAEMQSEVMTDITNDSAGHLTSTDDKKCRFHLQMNTYIFLVWLMWKADQIPASATYISSGVFPNYFEDFISYGGFYSASTDAEMENFLDADPWTNISKAADESDARFITGLFPFKDDDGNVVSSYYSSFTASGLESVINDQSWYGYPFDFPRQYRFAILPAKYNAQTFWLYCATAILAVTAVAVTTVLITRKVKQAIRNKRLSNTAKYQSDLATAQLAANGEKQVYDEATQTYKTVQFDVKSAEGQQYIKDVNKTLWKQQKTNNRWAALIGGTRYDMTTYYGDADAGDASSSSILSRIMACEQDTPSSNSAVDSEVQSLNENFSSIMGLIRGNA